MDFNDSLLLQCVERAEKDGDFDRVRSDFLKQAVAFRDEAAERIRQSHRQGASGSQTVLALTELMDRLICSLFRFAHIGLPAQHPCAVIAVGGYGRMEMNPCSDVDLMFYSGSQDSEQLNAVSQRMLYLLWDMKYDVGHCVRNQDECLDIAGRDLTATTALLDARFLCGDRTVYSHFQQQVLSRILNRSSRSFVRDKLEENDQRLKRFGSSVYLLEPNIKEGEGGLRDLQTALWICKVKFKVDDLRGLVMKGVISEAEASQYIELQDYLWRIRNELHYLSPRKNDQLHFDKQEQIASFLGYHDDKTGLAVEQFMQNYYETATHVEHLASTLIARAENTEQSEYRLIGYMRRRNIDESFYALRGELHITQDHLFEEDPVQMMRAFWLSQRHELKMCLRLKTLIRDNLTRINDKVRRSKRMNDLFLEILRYKKNVYETLKLMHHLLFLNQFIPEFKRIYCRVQHDAYHIYTVDIHTLFAIREITLLWQGVYRERKPLLTRLAGEVEKPELLILAILLHDIGKGEGSKHCEKGAAMIPTIARRMGLNREDSLRLEFLVRHHLQMAYISQRRDLHDDNLIIQFGQSMEMSENLNMLYLLTFADIKAVGPDVWTEWKGFLLQELYEKTYIFLEKGDFRSEKSSEKIRNRKRKVVALLEDEFSASQVKEGLRQLSTRYLMAHRSAQIAEHMRVVLNRGSAPVSIEVHFKPDASFTEVIIVTLDMPGLFTKITGVMAANGINILGAQIYTQKNGIALDILHVGSADGMIYDDPAKWKKVEEDLLWYLEERGHLEDAVEKRRASMRLMEKKSVPSSPPRVDIDNDISDEHTVIDITTRDEVGLLYTISRALNELGLYVSVAKITTKGRQAGDTFYVKDIFGSKICQQEKLNDIRKLMLEHLQ